MKVDEEVRVLSDYLFRDSIKGRRLSSSIPESSEETVSLPPWIAKKLFALFMQGESIR